MPTFRPNLPFSILVIFLTIVGLFISFLNPPSPSSPVSLPDPTDDQALVTRVIDGDTIEVTQAGQTHKVRLIGVNAPESVDPRRPVECYGQQAGEYLSQLLANQLVTLESDPSQQNRDKYDRLLRYVFLENGILANLELIRQGFAYEYTYDQPYQYRDDFRQAQTLAQSSTLGLWDPQACPSVSPTPAPTINPDCAIKGNISSSGEKIYHLPSCRDYNRTSINETSEERWFCSEQEAIDAGWRKAGNC